MTPDLFKPLALVLAISAGIALTVVGYVRTLDVPKPAPSAWTPCGMESSVECPQEPRDPARCTLVTPPRSLGDLQPAG